MSHLDRTQTINLGSFYTPRNVVNLVYAMLESRLDLGKYLVLDEPTNHLDLESIIALGEALYKFGGNVICVSHDRELIDAYANRTIELVPNTNGAAQIIDFRGTYEEYLESKGGGHSVSTK